IRRAARRARRTSAAKRKRRTSARPSRTPCSRGLQRLGAYSLGVSLFEPLFEALNTAEVRYVVVGGFAVVLHGHARLTADIDLIRLKRIAGRPQDLADIEALELILRRRGNPDAR